MSLPPDTRAAVHAYFKSLGSTDAQALDAEVLHTSKFDWVGDTLVLKETMKPVTDPSVSEWLEANAPHLLPTKITIDEADAAFTGKDRSRRRWPMPKHTAWTRPIASRGCTACTPSVIRAQACDRQKQTAEGQSEATR